MTTYFPLKDFGHNLISKAVPIVPIMQNKKYPGIDGWQRTIATVDQLHEWQKSHTGIGLLTDRFPTIDVDLTGDHNADNVLKVFGICEEELGTVEFTKVGESPKISIICRSVGSFGKKIKTPIRIDPKTKKELAVEILGTGQQTVLYGIHPDTEKPYYWKRRELIDESFTVEQLPILTRDKAQRILDRIDDEVLAHLPLKKQKPQTPVKLSTVALVDSEYVSAAVSAELSDLAGTTEGGRNEQLNISAFALGQFVGSGVLDENEAKSRLTNTALGIGLSEAEATKTINSGIEAGKLEPRGIPEPAFKRNNAAHVEYEAEEWQEPIPLPDELSPVTSFDYELLPATLKPWIKDICERMQCPPDFVAVAVMSALGSVIGRKIGIRPQSQTDWTVVANLWAFIIGRPGVMKSPAIEAALGPLKMLAVKAYEQFVKEDREYQVEQRAAKLRFEANEKEARAKLKRDPNADLSTVFTVPEVVIPTLKRYLVNDSTSQALGELHRLNHNGFLVHRDEMVSLLRSLDREENAEGRGFYLTGWNGDSAYTFDRIGRGMNLHIPAVCLSLLGGTQPGRLSGYIDHAVKGGSADDGLIQRFGLIVWPDVTTVWKDVDRAPDREAKNQAHKVFSTLDNLDPAEIGAQQDTDFDGRPYGMPYLRFDAAAIELFLAWRHDLELRLRSGDLHPALESHLAKYRKLVPGLALILHIAEGNRGPVTARSILQALAWSEYLETHAHRAYSSATQPNTSTAKEIIKRIRKHDLVDGFSVTDVWRPGWSKLRDRSQVADALRLLVDYNWLFEIHDKETGGRPKTTYTINPKVSQ